MNRILNVPNDGYEYEFRVAIKNEDDDYEWYCNCSDAWEAERIALEVGGIIIHNVRLQGIQKKES